MQDIIQGLHPLERKIIPFLKNTMLFQELLEQTKMQEAEVMRALQWMENKELLKIKTETKETITFGDLGKKYSREGLPERRLLEQLKKKTKDIIQINIEKTRTITLTELGKKLLKEKIDVNLLETLSHDLLKTGKWQGKKFRKYDVKINVPKIYGGRRQPYMEFLNKIKVQLVQLGFKEMS